MTSGRASPRSVQFQSTLRSQSPPRNGLPVTQSDYPRVPLRSLSNTTISDENKSASIHHGLQDCDDRYCAFGWETYVCNHDCQKAESRGHKISIHKLLHEAESNPLLEQHVEGVIRHVHLPANNMKWVEVSISACSSLLRTEK